jgi:hypothetical protein
MAEKSTTPEGGAGHQGQAAKPATANTAARPDSKGFKLPDPNTQPPALSAATTTALPGASQAAPTAATLTTVPAINPSGGVKADTGPRDLAIGGGVWLVLVIAFFFAKTGYANMLVGKRVAPRSANASGWWLFILLTSLATGGVLAVVDQERFLAPIYIAGFVGVALLALILMLMTGRR